MADAPPYRPDGLTLVLGGARSGKSTVAEQLLERHDGPLLYVATGSVRAADGSIDPEMAARVARHVERRGLRYHTVEAGADVVGALAGAAPQPALVDSLGTWVAAHHDPTTGRFPCDPEALRDALVAHPAPVVVVADEVGLGVHPSTEAGRRFRDVQGTVNAVVAEAADLVLLVVAGRVLVLPTLADALSLLPAAAER